MSRIGCSSSKLDAVATKIGGIDFCVQVSLYAHTGDDLAITGARANRGARFPRPAFTKHFFEVKGSEKSKGKSGLIMPDFKALLLAIVALLSVAGPSQAVPSIDNRSYWDGSSGIGGFGSMSNGAWGQVFLPSGPETVLDSFTFSLSRDPFNQISFQAFVQQFDTLTQSSVGNILFTSAVFSTSLATYDFDEFFFSTGGLQLDPNSTYIAYLSVGLLPETPPAQQLASISPAPVNPSLGGLYYFNSSNNFSSSTGYDTQTWNTIPDFQLAFSANFSAAVPEIDASAATLPLSAALIALLIIADRRQRLTV